MRAGPGYVFKYGASDQVENRWLWHLGKIKKKKLSFRRQSQPFVSPPEEEEEEGEKEGIRDELSGDSTQ